MTYTFDEAIEELRLAIPEKFYSPTMHDIAVMLEAQTKVINLLREEYAPTIEMTKLKRGVFADEMEDIATQEELDLFINDGLNLGDMTFRKALNAWIHPETIKVVDE